eukprot:TRINITY_DN7514_c0_g1_i3.p1 TRINITY_DN7514_c0_g1~~TRINITY_DN7514_c0_g1_i3.p1  ORF type:complete len:343 (+),score=67.76 TRINITY_DN7514_c0_g1_i3:74-1102(+)
MNTKDQSFISNSSTMQKDEITDELVNLKHEFSCLAGNFHLQKAEYPVENREIPNVEKSISHPEKRRLGGGAVEVFEIEEDEEQDISTKRSKKPPATPPRQSRRTEEGSIAEINYFEEAFIVYSIPNDIPPMQHRKPGQQNEQMKKVDQRKVNHLCNEIGGLIKDLNGLEFTCGKGSNSDGPSQERFFYEDEESRNKSKVSEESLLVIGRGKERKGKSIPHVPTLNISTEDLNQEGYRTNQRYYSTEQEYRRYLNTTISSVKSVQTRGIDNNGTLVIEECHESESESESKGTLDSRHKIEILEEQLFQALQMIEDLKKENASMVGQMVLMRKLTLNNFSNYGR